MVELSKWGKPLVIAHRGARSIAPENTLAAAEAGWRVGADWWELDVAVSRDGELVVLHDDTLVRTSNAAQVFPQRSPWRVWDFSFAELRSLDFGSWFAQTDPFGQIAAGQVSQEALAGFAGLQIPTLREALEWTRAHDWRVNIEIKDASGTPADSSIAEQVVDLVRQLGMDERVLISSFNHDYIVRVRAANPALRTGALVEQPGGTPDPLELLVRTGASAFNPQIGEVFQPQIELLRQAGKDVFVWTVNEETDLRELIRQGVSGLFTDFPQRMRAILDEA